MRQHLLSAFGAAVRMRDGLRYMLLTLLLLSYALRRLVFGV